MPTMNFPSLPTLGDEYLFNNTTYVYDGTKWVAKQSNEQNINQMIESHKVGVDQHNIAGIQGLADALSKTGDAVLDVKWLTKRSPMRTGYAAGDGQYLSRALYPDAIAAIQASLVPVCSDAEWLADPAKRGCFTLGDGFTTFRVPDYNGMQPGSYGPVYLGGGSAASGAILRDRIQDITGSFQRDAGCGVLNPQAVVTGAFKQGAARSYINASTNASGYDIGFDASLVARTGDTTRPITAEGCLAIKLFGAVQNAGSADAAALATAVADIAARVVVLESKVTALEQRKSTCLVNAIGTGAPHETVVTQIPTNIVTNTRYVIPNPFGNNTPVQCIAEVKQGDKWFAAGWLFTGANQSYGVSAGYVQGEGIVLQTARSYLTSSGVDGGGVGGQQSSATSLPCRVFVSKLET